MAMDFGGYRDWQILYSDNGQAYYVVPGMEDYLYDPVTSAAIGKPYLVPNPTAANQIQQKEEQKVKDEARRQEESALVNTAAGTAGTVAGAYGIHALTKEPAEKAAGEVIKDVVAPNITETGAQAGKEALTQAATQAAGQEGYGGVGESLLNLPSAYGGGITGFAVPAAIVGQTILSGKEAFNMLQGDSKRIDQLGLDDVKNDPFGIVGRAGLAIATGGLSEIANSFLSHKSTKDYQKQRQGELLGRGITGYEGFLNQAMENDKDYQEKFGDKITGGGGVRTDLASDFVGYDPESGRWINNKFAQSLDKKDLQVEDAWGSQGAFDAGGDRWLGKLNEEQRREVTQQALDEGLFDTDKGDVIIKTQNQERFNQLIDEALKGGS